MYSANAPMQAAPTGMKSLKTGCYPVDTMKRNIDLQR